MKDTQVVRNWLHSWSFNMLHADAEGGMRVADLTRQCFHFLGRIDKDGALEDMYDFWWLCVSRTILRLLHECQQVGIDCNYRQGISIMHSIHGEEEFS